MNKSVGDSFAEVSKPVGVFVHFIEYRSTYPFRLLIQMPMTSSFAGRNEVGSCRTNPAPA